MNSMLLAALIAALLAALGGGGSVSPMDVILPTGL
jgi:hypothetical protein